MNKLIILLAAFMTVSSPPLLAQQNYTDLDCLVRPEMYVELSSPVDTTLSEILVEIGDPIKKGQPLVDLENSVEKAKVKLAEEKAASTAEIEDKKVQLTYALRNKQRIVGMFKKKSVSQYEKDKAVTEASLAELELIKAREQRELAKLELERTKVELDLRTLKSPIDGIVVDIYAHAGESVAERSIMKLAQINPLRVELIAPTEYFGLIKKGMEVEITPERPTNKSYTAKVTIVDQLIDPASGSFTVRMALPNPDDRLVGGVNCMARFNFAAPGLDESDLFSALDDEPAKNF